MPRISPSKSCWIREAEEKSMNRRWIKVELWFEFGSSVTWCHMYVMYHFGCIYISAVDVAPGDSIQAMPFGRRRIRELDEAAVSGSAGWRHDDCTKWQGMLIYCHFFIGFVCECMCNWHLAVCGGASLASTPRENDELKMAHGINRCFHSIEKVWMDLRWSCSFPANTLANNRGLTWPKTLEGDWVAASSWIGNFTLLNYNLVSSANLPGFIHLKYKSYLI